MGGKSPLIVYPSDQTRFPRNLYRTLFQWRTQGFSEFRLTFTGPYSTVTVYTDGVHGLCAGKNPAAGCWEVDEVDWNYIAGSNAGETATWTVDALDKTKMPPVVHGSKPITIGFSKQDVKGAIFYWSTTSAGVRRGKISKQNPEDYIVAKPPTTYPDGDTVKCVACHVVSRDGKFMAAPVSATSGQSMWILGITAAAPPDPLVKKIDNSGGHAFATISPDDKYVIVSLKGKMWLVDRATGAFVKDITTGALMGTQPDWSPLGDKVAFATGSGDGPSGSSLAILPVTGDAMFGMPTALVPPPAGLSNLFPSFSPDAEWIAYAKGKGGHGDNTAQLMLVNQAGGQPIELIKANRVTSNLVTNGQYQNSQPTWAPPGDYNWVAFNTKREYGVVLPTGTQQIWVAAIDLKAAKAGGDPSFPAFRVPFQGLAENNHRAYWTLDITDTPGTGGGGGMGGSGMGGGGAGGTPQQCGSIIGIGFACDPLFDCCESGSLCDTKDSGVTYSCNPPG
jgi:dipeptidyl aminopeptidase/acylaminoacyl peptidase